MHRKERVGWNEYSPFDLAKGDSCELVGAVNGGIDVSMKAYTGVRDSCLKIRWLDRRSSM